MSDIETGLLNERIELENTFCKVYAGIIVLGFIAFAVIIIILNTIPSQIG